MLEYVPHQDRPQSCNRTEKRRRSDQIQWKQIGLSRQSVIWYLIFPSTNVHWAHYEHYSPNNRTISLCYCIKI